MQLEVSIYCSSGKMNCSGINPQSYFTPKTGEGKIHKYRNIVWPKTREIDTGMGRNSGLQSNNTMWQRIDSLPQALVEELEPRPGPTTSRGNPSWNEPHHKCLWNTRPLSAERHIWVRFSQSLLFQRSSPLDRDAPSFLKVHSWLLELIYHLLKVAGFGWCSCFLCIWWSPDGAVKERVGGCIGWSNMEWKSSAERQRKHELAGSNPANMQTDVG